MSDEHKRIGEVLADVFNANDPIMQDWAKVSWQLAKLKELEAAQPTDEQLKHFGYAPGYYNCKCCKCAGDFPGDKRAIRCHPCAHALALSQPNKGSTDTGEQP